MDGVLCDLYGAFIRKVLTKKVGIHINDPYEDKSNWGKSIYDVTVQPSIFFQLIDNAEFWAGLEWTEDGQEILKKIEETFGRENCFILSAPTRNSSSFGKMTWLRNKLPRYIEDRRFVLTKHKYLCAGPNRYLFDDDPGNLNKFIQFGGVGSLVRRPWNVGHSFPDSTNPNDKNVSDKITNLLEYFYNKEMCW